MSEVSVIGAAIIVLTECLTAAFYLSSSVVLTHKHRRAPHYCGITFAGQTRNYLLVHSFVCYLHGPVPLVGHICGAGGDGATAQALPCQPQSYLLWSSGQVRCSVRPLDQQQGTAHMHCRLFASWSADGHDLERQTTTALCSLIIAAAPVHY